ncbi:MAG TPA: universal stress protein [Dehalococcoidia bacterium]|nr:universal stress protein [Dehalococcoidia bacterium]
MYDRVLLPLDGSEIAEAVEPHTMALAKKFDSEVILMRVVTPVSKLLASMVPGRAAAGNTTPVGVEAAHAQLESETRDAAQYLSSVAQRFEAEGVAARTLAIEGEPAQTIIENAKDANVSVICMSTSGRSRLGRLIFGSVADEVLRKSHLPLLLIRPQQQ